MTTELTKRMVAGFRNSAQAHGSRGGVMMRAILELADERDALLAACEAALPYIGKDIVWSRDSDSDERRQREVISQIETAIRMAKGESDE